MTPPEVYSIKDGDEWKIRVIPNKFPAVSMEGEMSRDFHILYNRANAIGRHEVVIEARRHDLSIATMSEQQVRDVVKVYRDRYKEIMKIPYIQYITIFRNYGRKAGSSLIHPHSQIIAVPIVPMNKRITVSEAMRFYDETGECIYCKMMREELKHKERIVLENEHFVVFEPYASRLPFETWIMPKHHEAGFDQASDECIETLGTTLKIVLAKIYNGLKNPHYNYMILSAPKEEVPAAYYHWHIQILPRLTTPAGFEMGSGIYINVTLPEECAAHLRNWSAEIPPP